MATLGVLPCLLAGLRAGRRSVDGAARGSPSRSSWSECDRARAASKVSGGTDGFSSTFFQARPGLSAPEQGHYHPLRSADSCTPVCFRPDGLARNAVLPPRDPNDPGIEFRNATVWTVYSHARMVLNSGHPGSATKEIVMTRQLTTSAAVFESPHVELLPPTRSSHRPSDPRVVRLPFHRPPTLRSRSTSVTPAALTSTPSRLAIRLDPPPTPDSPAPGRSLRRPGSTPRSPYRGDGGACLPGRT